MASNEASVAKYRSGGYQSSRTHAHPLHEPGADATEAKKNEVREVRIGARGTLAYWKCILLCRWDTELMRLLDTRFAGGYSKPSSEPWSSFRERYDHTCTARTEVG